MGTEEAAWDPNRFQATDFQIVLPSYFETMRTPLLAGRTFTRKTTYPAALISLWMSLSLAKLSLANRRSESISSFEFAPRTRCGSLHLAFIPQKQR